MRAVIGASVVAVGAAVSGGHVDRVAQIQTILDQPNVLWRPALNGKFGSEAPGASKPLCGVKASWKSHLAESVERGIVKRFNESSGRVADALTPERFDSATAWPKCAKMIGDIRDQSNCGCCWAFGAASAASDRLCIATGAKIMVPLSAQDICFCASDDGCNGGDIDSPWSHIKGGEWNPNGGAVSGGQFKGSGPFGAGMCSDFSLPHCHHHGPQGKDPYPAEGKPGCASQKSPQCPAKCDAGSKVHDGFKKDKYFFTGDVLTAEGEAQIMQAIMDGGPVETAFHVYSDFENYASGIYHHVTGEALGGHAVRIVGWGAEGGSKYWKVANSWNSYWGEEGYFRIKKGTNECGIEDFVTFSASNAKWKRVGDATEIESVVV